MALFHFFEDSAVRSAEDALASYELSGVAGLRRALERTFGATFIHRELLSRPGAREKVQKAYEVLSKVYTLIKMGQLAHEQLPAAYHEVLKFLPGGTSTP